MDESVSMVIMLIPALGIVSGAAIVLLGMHHHAKLKELQFRERIAMIEKGLVPSPEGDPKGFEEMLGRSARRPGAGADYSGSGRHRAAGVVFIGLGLALMLLIGFAGGEPGAGIGVGGALMVLGGAFVVNSMLAARDAARATQWRTSGAAPPSTRDPASPS